MRDSDTWFSSSSLLCNEDQAWLKDEAKKTCVDLDPCFVQENGDEYFEYLVERESTSSGSKSCESTSSVSSITSPNWSETARLGAIQWIFNTRAIFGFKYHTAYLSITYFDRFFSKRVVHDGQLWAIEIISLACLTLAAKMEEYTVPPLSAFWVEGHDFDSKSIKKTELMVLSTLRWNMGSITPFHYLHYFINRLCGEYRPRELVSRAVELIMAITKEINLMDHRPSVIAAAAVLVIIDGRLTKKALEQKMSGISLWRSQEHDHIFSCYKIMLNIELDELETPTSAVSSNLSSTGSNSIDVMGGSSSIRVAGPKRRLPFTIHDQHCPVKRSRGPYLSEFDLLNKD